MLSQNCISKQNKPKIIGLTGGIGSGKTTVAKCFQSHGIPVFIADDEAKILMETDEITNEIKNVFGTSIFEENKLNRKKLADIVFNDAKKLKLLNAIIHPAVTNRFEEWLEQQKDFPFVIFEVAILFENGSYTKCDKIITVIANEEERIDRVMKRENTTKEKILERMQFQWTDEERIAKSDYIIQNNDLQILKDKVEAVLHKLRTLFN